MTGVQGYSPCKCLGSHRTSLLLAAGAALAAKGMPERAGSPCPKTLLRLGVPPWNAQRNRHAGCTSDHPCTSGCGTSRDAASTQTHRVRMCTGRHACRLPIKVGTSLSGQSGSMAEPTQDRSREQKSALACLAEVWACAAAVGEFLRASAPRFFAGVNKRALSPVMSTCLGAAQNLEVVHAELISAVLRQVDVRQLGAASGVWDMWALHTFTSMSSVGFRNRTNGHVWHWQHQAYQLTTTTPVSSKVSSFSCISESIGMCSCCGRGCRC